MAGTVAGEHAVGVAEGVAALLAARVLEDQLAEEIPEGW